MKRALPLVLIAALAPLAFASHTRVRLERVSPTEDGKLLVYASIVELEGNLGDDRAPPAFQLKINGKSVGRPEKAARFRTAGEPLDLVLVVETSALYGPQKVLPPPPAPPPPPRVKGKKGSVKTAPKGKSKPVPVAPPPPPPAAPGDLPLDRVKDALHQLLEAAPPRSRVLVIEYGGDVITHPPFRPAASAGGAVDDLSPDDESGDLVMVSAVKAALVELNKPRPDGDSIPPRRLIVVISDGLNSTMDRKTFRLLGEAAAKAHVPIHTIAFSPNDERGPLLNLGEISKRSNGTFRWARTPDALHEQMETLADELNKQYVLTFDTNLPTLEGKKFVLTVEDMESNPLTYGADIKAPRNFAWGFWLIILAGVLAVGGAVLVVLTRPKKRFATTRGAGASLAPVARPVAQQPIARPAPQPQPVAARGVVVVASGSMAGQRFVLGPAPTTVGKGPSTIQISDDPTVSTRHAQLHQAGADFVLTDLGSTNGTFLNNQRVTQPVRLGDGDLIRFGNTQIKFRRE